MRNYQKTSGEVLQCPLSAEVDPSVTTGLGTTAAPSISHLVLLLITPLARKFTAQADWAIKGILRTEGRNVFGFCLLVSLFLFPDKVSLCNIHWLFWNLLGRPGWSGTPRDPPASAATTWLVGKFLSSVFIC